MTGDNELLAGELESGGEFESGGPDRVRVGCDGALGVKNPTWRTLGTTLAPRRWSMESEIQSLRNLFPLIMIIRLGSLNGGHGIQEGKTGLKFREYNKEKN